MQIKKTRRLAVLAAAAMCTAGVAFAGPPVYVTFKNLGAQTVAYEIVTNNEASTYANSTPSPRATVGAQETNVYKVQSRISADAHAAIVRYTTGRKTCVFNTTFLNLISGSFLLRGNSAKVPRWNKSASSGGGAICTATITSQNFADYSWAVEFTMR